MAKVYKSASTVFNLRHSGKSDWYRIEDKGSMALVYIYDEIGMMGITASQFVKDLSGVTGPIEVHLSTPGGEVFDGLAIYNALKNRKGVTVVVDSIAASIGSVIAMAADPGKLFMEPHAKMMIHDGFAMAAGNAAELGKMVEQLNSASDTIAGVYAARTGQPTETWRAAMQEETWYTAEEAVAAGLADAITGTKNVTSAILNQDSAAVNASCDPDGDGDDDSTPEGDTDHDYWDEDGNQIQALPGRPMPETDELAELLINVLRNAADDDTDPDACPKCKGNGRTLHPDTGKNSKYCPACKGTGKKPDVTDSAESDDDDDDQKQPFPGAATPFRKSSDALDKTPWNAAQAYRDAAASADPAAYYAGICAGKRRGDPSLQSSWALPYKKTPESLPNAEAVAQCLTKLHTADIINGSQARETLLSAQKIADTDFAIEQVCAAQDALAAILANQDIPYLEDVETPLTPVSTNFAHNAAPVNGVYAAQPYHRRPGDDIQCPGCRLFNTADARHCDQCGIRITGRPDVLVTDGPGTIPGQRVSNASVDNSPWNASQAWHNGATSSDPASFYAGICAGQKSGDKANQSSWALPYKYHPGDPPNAAGVRNALARLDQTQGLTNKSSAQSLLEGLMKKINPDYEPSDDIAEIFRSLHSSLKEGSE